MDRFYDEQYVRLRNRELDKYYLHADDDGVGVSISQRRNSLNVAWKVHIYQGSCGPYLLLLSAAYGRYLAATATPAPALYHGFCAELRDYNHPEVPEIMWLDVRAGLGRGVLLLNAGDRYLRANGKYLRWNTGVTVESRYIENEKVSAMMRWIVVPIALTERAPRIPDPIRARLPEDLSVIVFGRQPGAWRGIRFVQATPEGVYPEAQQGWAAFHIRGRSLYNLRDRLAREVDQQPDGIAMCVRADRYGKPTPLVVDLPHGGPEKIGNHGSGEMFLKQLEERNDCKSKPSEAGSEQSVRRELSPNPSVVGSAGESLMEHPDISIEATRAKFLVATNRRHSIAKELTQATNTLAFLQQQNVGALPKEERKGAVKQMRNVKEKIRKLGVAAALADEEVANEHDAFARSQLRHRL